MKREFKTQSELKISGMDCASCAQKIEKSLKNLDGATEVEVNFVSEKVKIEFDKNKISLDCPTTFFNSEK